MSAELTSTQDTARREFVMVTLWERMSDFFGNSWGHNYGLPGGRSMKTWMAGLAGYSEKQIRMGVELSRRWSQDIPPGKYVNPPDLGQFAKLCLTKAPAPTPPPSEVKSLSDLTKIKPEDSAIVKHEKARLTRIPASPKSREASDDDVESFDESYSKRRLHARWGAA
jgi:hypothetical protein